MTKENSALIALVSFALVLSVILGAFVLSLPLQRLESLSGVDCGMIPIESVRLSVFYEAADDASFETAFSF